MEIIMAKKIIVYGDSNTYGFDPTGNDWRYPASDRWCDLLNQENEWDIIAKGMNGREIPHTPSQLTALKDMLSWNSPFDLLIIMLGTNDILNMYYHPELTAVKMRMSSLLTELTAHFAVPPQHILLLSPPSIQTPDALCNRLTDQLGYEYRKIALLHHTLFTDTQGWNTALSRDGVHFTARGHHTFARHMSHVLHQIWDI